MTAMAYSHNCNNYKTTTPSCGLNLSFGASVCGFVFASSSTSCSSTPCNVRALCRVFVSSGESGFFGHGVETFWLAVVSLSLCCCLSSSVAVVVLLHARWTARSVLLAPSWPSVSAVPYVIKGLRWLAEPSWFPQGPRHPLTYVFRLVCGAGPHRWQGLCAPQAQDRPQERDHR